MTEIDYKQKYLKYKTKYLKIKGGYIDVATKQATNFANGVIGLTSASLNSVNPFSNKTIAEKTTDFTSNLARTGTLGFAKKSDRNNCLSINNPIMKLNAKGEFKTESNNNKEIEKKCNYYPTYCEFDEKKKKCYYAADKLCQDKVNDVLRRTNCKSDFDKYFCDITIPEENCVGNVKRKGINYECKYKDKKCYAEEIEIIRST